MWDIYFFVLNFKYLIHPQQNTHQTQLKKKNSLWTLLLLLLFFYQIFFFCFKKHCTRFFLLRGVLQFGGVEKKKMGSREWKTDAQFLHDGYFLFFFKLNLTSHIDFNVSFIIT
jgi:hypothetical protein